MKTALTDVSNPADHSVQAVLPGVLDHMQANRHCIQQTVREEVGGLEERMISFHHQEKLSMIAAIQAGLTTFAAQGAQQVEHVTGTSPSPHSNLMPTTTINDPPMSRPTPSNNELEVVSTHELQHKHATIKTVYEEFYGLGEFQGKPIAGGISALENKYGTKWRNLFGKKRKAAQVGRIKQVIKCLSQWTIDLGTIELAIEKLDTIFQDETIRCSIAKLVDHLKAEGVLTKQKPRGRGNR